MHQRVLAHSPSQHQVLQKDQVSQYSGVSQKKKTLIINSGTNSQASIQTGPNQNVIQIQGHSGQNYKRIVNIYSVNNYKNKRKSHAPENSRGVLNQSMLPSGQVKNHIGPYDDRRSHGPDISLP